MDVRQLFPSFPDETRIWIYLADRPLNQSEQSSLADGLRDFVQSWTSHGRRVEGAAEIVDDRAVILAGVIPGGDISGCGIDTSVRAVDEAARRLGIEWSPALFVTYRDDAGRLQTVSRGEFRQLAERGMVHAGTSVLDPSITSVGQLRQGQLEKPAGESWHARTFRLQQPAA